jgi:uncharacterized protein (DUF1778 family)
MALLLKPKTIATQDASAPEEASERIVLDDVSFEAFSAAMANPPRPNAKLRALFQKK